MDELASMIATNIPRVRVLSEERSLNIHTAGGLVATIQYYPPYLYSIDYVRCAPEFVGRIERTTNKLRVVIQLMRCVCYTNEAIFDVVMRHIAKEINAKNLFVDGLRALFIDGPRLVRVKMVGDLVKVGARHYSLSNVEEICDIIKAELKGTAKGMPVSVFERHIARLKEEIAQVYPALAAAEEIQILNREKFAFGSLSWFILADDWKTSKKLRAANRICAIRADVAALLPQPIAEEMTPHLV